MSQLAFANAELTGVCTRKHFFFFLTCRAAYCKGKKSQDIMLNIC